MGESRIVSTARLVAAVTAGLTATALLASCSGQGAAPGEVAPTAVQSAVSASPTSSPTASETVVPTPEATGAQATEPQTEATPVTTPASSGKGAVAPFITSVVWDAKSERLDVSAIVPKVLESSGTCTLTAVKGDASADVSGPAAPAASYTGCSQLAIAGAELTPGSWQVRVSYASDESAGTSDVRTVTVG